ncbi:MAG: chitobiase/beta-hexosaminidase C-terminal domain-containing protein [Calditrichia bacterium]|nr:chitobiase/beta-hexosaminidase C-terminal domain-containing protein [Calditrichia bacterium]
MTYSNFTIILLISFMALGIIGCSEDKSDWKPAEGSLLTKWADEITPENVLPEYPRPQLVREDWLNLNGLWDYMIIDKGSEKPQRYDGKILVPFPVESALSGVNLMVGKEKELWYRRSFVIPYDWQDKERVLLHFGAVDWETTVWINENLLGSHKGGYDSFSFDITDYLIDKKPQELVIKVWDPVDQGTQPRGKQVSEPRGIWYTSVTGIWQTVWLEPVSKLYIKSIKIIPDIDQARLDIELSIADSEHDYLLMSNLSLGGKQLSQVHTGPGNAISFDIENQQLWTPDNPVLYDLEINLLDAVGNLKDEIKSYVGMRKISISKYGSNIPKIFLNNEFVFQLGPLDQGWWPDGLYTAPTDEALKYDIEITKKLGFNMARKHVKVEPERWYYWCDKLGLLVWQDMPSGDEYIDPDEPDIKRTKESATQFENELREMVTQYGNHPSIVMWVPFNEGWGQYETEKISQFIKTLDSSRLVNNASGWADRGVGDVNDIHAYPGPAMPEPEKKRVIVLGEFGGLGLHLEGHTWQISDNWGYRSYENAEELTKAYTNLFRDLQPMIRKGLSAAVYTQTTDVEVEVNGLMTYDRAVIKMDPATVKRVNQGYLPPVIEAEHNIFTTSLSISLSNEIRKGQIYYTLDETDPNNNSQQFTKPVIIKDTHTIKAFTVFEDGTASDISETTFNKVSFTDPIIKEDLKSGISYEYSELEEKELEKLPDFESLSAKSTGNAKLINLEIIERDEYFALQFNGYVKIPADGIYTFYSSSDDGTKLFIHNELVVDNDYTHGMTEKSGDIALNKGLHPIKLNFFQGYGGKGLKVSYKCPGVDKQEIPTNVLFYE